jgi:hypothetical protein
LPAAETLTDNALAHLSFSSTNRLTFWMNGFLAALLVAVLGLCGILIGKL